MGSQVPDLTLGSCHFNPTTLEDVVRRSYGGLPSYGDQVKCAKDGKLLRQLQSLRIPPMMEAALHW